MKTLSSLIILLIGLNLATAGLAVGLCTGKTDCLYCAAESPCHSHDKPETHGFDPLQPLHVPCDFESNEIPAIYVLDALSSGAGSSEILSIQKAAASEPVAAESNQSRFSTRASAALFHRTSPLYILLLTILR